MGQKTVLPFPAFARWIFITLIFASLACAGWFLVHDLRRVADVTTEFRILPPFGAACMMSAYALLLTVILYYRDDPRRLVEKNRPQPPVRQHPDNRSQTPAKATQSALH